MATAPSIEFGQRHVSKGVARLSEDVIERGEGSWVKLRSGRTVLDFTCGIGVTNLGTLPEFFPRFGAEGRRHLGHCHPKVSKAAAEQCLNLVHGQVKYPPPAPSPLF
jgi:4-aminobutyrate aminotransferase